jgi:hypothetical protein
MKVEPGFGHQDSDTLQKEAEKVHLDLSPHSLKQNSVYCFLHPHSHITKQTSEKRIFSLEQENGLIEGQANLKAYITKFYKDLFGEPEVNSFTLDESRIEDIS